MNINAGYTIHIWKVEKRYKMQGLLSILSLFHNKFDKFINTGAQMLDFIH